MKTVFGGYGAAAAHLAHRFDAISAPDLYAPVLEFIPVTPGCALDVGAGSGRDAAWLSNLGHDVWAVEPVAELRNAAKRLHPEVGIRWLDDSLPGLRQVKADRQAFDLVFVSAVWQHLETHNRSASMATLAALLSVEGKLIISLRHGPGAPTRPCFPCEPFEAISAGEKNGLVLVCQREAASTQAANRAAGVTWTWLVFSKTAVWDCRTSDLHPQPTFVRAVGSRL